MATRLYLSSTAVPDIEPLPSYPYQSETGFDRRVASTVKDNSALTSKVTGAIGFASPAQGLNRQYITGELEAQTISSAGTIAFCIQGRISSTAAGAAGNMIVKVTILRGSAYTVVDDDNAGGTNYTTTVTSRYDTSSILADITVLDGDRLVFEIAWFYSNGTNTSRTVTQRFGSSSATDLAANNTTTTDNNPWIEFSQTLNFKTALPGKRLGLLGVG